MLMDSIFSKIDVDISVLPQIANLITDSSIQRFKFNLVGLFTLLTDSVQRQSTGKEDLSAAQLLKRYTAAAQQYGDKQVIKQSDPAQFIKNMFVPEAERQAPASFEYTVNDIMTELLQANAALLPSLYALKPRDLAAELYAYFYQIAPEADLSCFPIERCAGVLDAWLTSKADGTKAAAGSNFLLMGKQSFLQTFDLPGSCFIGLDEFFGLDARSKDYFFNAADFVQSALKQLCPKAVQLFPLSADNQLGAVDVLPDLKHPHFQYFDAAFVLPLCGQIQDFSLYPYMLDPETARKRTELEITKQALRCTQGRVISQVLVSELSGSAVQFKKFRRQLCADRLLKAVCQLPKNFYQQDIDPSALLFMTTDIADRSDAVTLIDLSGFDLKKNPEDWEEVLQILGRALNGEPTPCSASVSYQDIKVSGCILLPSIYCSGSRQLLDTAVQTYGSCLLSDVAEIIRCQAAAADGDAPMYEVQMSSIDQFGFIDPAKVSKAINCHPDDPQILKQRLQENDIILAVKGAGIGTAAIAHHAGDNWLGSQYFVIIRRRPDAPLSVEELFFALRSDAVQAFAKTNAKGAKLPLLSAKTLSTMPLIAAAADKHDAKANFTRLCELRDSIQQMTAEALSLSFSQVLPASAE